MGGLAAGYIGPSLDGLRDRPFSADVLNEFDQFLADGNHIHLEYHGRIFRDSEGRVRSEDELTGVGSEEKLVYIQISDPVEKLLINLDPQKKLATVYHLGTRGRSQRDPVHPIVPRAPVQSTPATAARPTHAPVLPKTETTAEDLGTMEIEGFIARGFRTTSTTAAGVMGNDKPMVTINEHWYSEELETMLLSKSSSPQSGLQTRKLTNIRNENPDPLLFQVPADYTVKDEQ